MHTVLLAVIMLALGMAQVSAFFPVRRANRVVRLQAKPSLYNLKEQLTSPDDRLVDRIASWQADDGYKRLSVSDAMKISGMKQEEVGGAGVARSSRRQGLARRRKARSCSNR